MSRRKRYTRNLWRRLPEPLPEQRPSALAWVRFEHVREPYGVFCYIDEAKERVPALDAELEEIHGWFERWLGAPTRFGEERFWFRADATRHVEMARRLAALVRSAGIPIVERRICRLPGIVRWRDAEQIAVITFRDTRRRAATLDVRDELAGG